MAATAPQTRAGNFESWSAERDRIDRELERTPEAEEARRDSLLDRSYELERMILDTHCLELPAIRAKVRLLLWLMTVERADGLSAMRDIQAYLERGA